MTNDARHITLTAQLVVKVERHPDCAGKRRGDHWTFEQYGHDSHCFGSFSEASWAAQRAFTDHAAGFGDRE